MKQGDLVVLRTCDIRPITLENLWPSWLVAAGALWANADDGTGCMLGMYICDASGPTSKVSVFFGARGLMFRVADIGTHVIMPVDGC